MSESIGADRQSAIRNPSSAIVLNTRALVGPNAGLWQRAHDVLRSRAAICGELETRGDGENVARIARLIGETLPQTVVAAGGDGTVSEVTQAIMRTDPGLRPALAIMPLGTANDIARSFGLLSFRQRGAAAVERALSAMLEGLERRVDLGEASINDAKRYFVGSFTIGMDAAILATRNRLSQRLRLGRRLGGYPLYLWSCAVNVTMHRSDLLRLRVDGAERTSLVYNLLVANTPQYAGEFRFDADNTSDDGYLDLHLFTGALDYLRRYPAAWRRHVHYSRGERVAPPPDLQRIRELVIESAAPVAAQLDGEEWETAASYHVRVVPQALTLRVHPPANHQPRARVTMP